MARRRDSSSSDSSEKEDGEFLQKESENTVRKSESNSSDSDRETRKRRSGGGRRRSPERRERVERRRSASDSGEEELERRRVERERDRRKTDEEDGRRRYNAGKETKERDSDRKNSDGEVDKGRRDDSGRREREESDKEDDGRDKDRSRKREEGRYGDRERDYERRRKSEREGNRRREDNDRGSRGRHRGSEGKEEDGDDKELEQRDGNVRRSEGKDKRYKERGKYSERERDDDEKDDRKDRRQRSSRHVENDDKGHRRQELEDRNVGREDDKGADHGKERRKEQDRERETKREDEGKDRRRRKEDAENMVENEGKLDERRGEGRVTDDVKVPKLENLGRSGGVYIPPFKLARMMKEVEDKSSLEYQRMTWDALRKSINGLVNKVNATNIKNIIPELFAENLIRGRGLFCRSCMKSQMASPAFTDVFAALVAVVNTKFPEVGELLLKRIILQLQRAYKRNDKPQLLAAVKFIAHLVNQQIVHELIALELLTILLENPTDDSVEVAVGFVTECGSILQDLCARGLHGIFERFRGILHEGEIDKRVQFLIEGLFALRKAKFSSYPAVRPELDLVEQEDQLTHEISLSDQIDPEIALDIFKQDPNFLENERKYEEVKKSILGEESEDEEAGSDEGDEESDEDEEESDEEDEEQMKIKDETETNLINLRRTIYLTIMSSVDFEEAGHKLMKIKLEPGQEMELCIMMLECCSQERTYLRYYGLLGQRFCMINKVYQENFDKCFVQQYSMIHRLETNKLRNVAKFFAHLLGTHALPWQVLAYIRLTEEDTTSSSRIFIKILFQELSEHLGIRLLNERLNDPTMQDCFMWIFPKDNPKNTRFAINFFTSIGLGGITESLREYLKNMPRLIMQQQKPVSESEDESGSSSSSGSDSSGSDSESESSSSEESDDKRRKRRRRT